MEFFTHIRMSLALKRAIEKITCIKLDTMSFIYGNIKPDISNKYVKIPHFKKSSMGFVKERIAALSSTKIASSKCTKEFSQSLGIITHYLSDFFCYAHSDTFNGGAIKHLSYENRLTTFCRTTNVLKNLVANAKQNLNLIDSIDLSPRQLNKNAISKNMIWIEKIYSILEHMHNIYSEQCPSYRLDISSAFNACTLLSVVLVTNCISDSLEIAA